LVRAAGAPIVAAAADLQFALSEMRNLFGAATGQDVKLSFGSSGNIARQIRSWAPIELFLSADESYALALARDGLTEGEGVLYAEGRIVIIVPHGSPLKADGSLEDLKAALANGRVEKFAIANPEHAPYGKRAKEVLIRKELWRALEGKLVFGENVSQAAQFATSGAAQGGIIAYSLALSPDVGRSGTFALIPAEWHEPLRQRMVLVKGAGNVARQFFQFVQQPQGRAVLEHYGFVLPNE
jgi:molybdate transport system substrate-binding protein